MSDLTDGSEAQVLGGRKEKGGATPLQGLPSCHRKWLMLMVLKDSTGQMPVTKAW